jgi:hypothetical protein
LRFGWACANHGMVMSQVMLRKYRQESANKVHQWFDRDSSLLSALLPTAGTLSASGSASTEAGEGGAGSSVRKVLSGVWSKLMQPDSFKDSIGGGQRQRRQQHRATLVGIETANIQAAESRVDELAALWCQEIMPHFEERIRCVPCVPAPLCPHQCLCLCLRIGGSFPWLVDLLSVMHVIRGWSPDGTC